jgi:hypothetical protein
MAWIEFNRFVIDLAAYSFVSLASVVTFNVNMTVLVRRSALLRVALKCHLCSL